MKNTKNDLNGFLIIDKAYDVGSTDIVNQLKHLLNPCKIGHAGTLDPLATGVLPVALGHATKLIPFIMDGQKTYEFDVQWGTETASDDLGSDILFTSDKRPTKRQIEHCISHFIGDVLQTPPTYSAIKINGKRAYDLARSGQDVVLNPRKIHIDSLTIQNYTENETSFRVECSKGTYVRTIAHDLGRMLECYGVVTKLRRTKCGPFTVKDALCSNDLSALSHQTLVAKIIPLEKMASVFPNLCLPLELTLRLVQGQRLNLNTITPYLSQPIQDQDFIALIDDSKFLGLLQLNHHTVQPYRIFSRIK